MMKIKSKVLAFIVWFIYFLIYLFSCLFIVFVSNIHTTLAMLFFNMFIGIVVVNFYRLNSVVNVLSYKNISVRKSEKQIKVEISLMFMSYILMFFLLAISGGAFEGVDFSELKKSFLSYYSTHNVTFIIILIALLVITLLTSWGLSDWSYKVVLYKGDLYVTTQNDRYLLDNYELITNIKGKQYIYIQNEDVLLSYKDSIENIDGNCKITIEDEDYFIKNKEILVRTTNREKNCPNRFKRRLNKV